MTPFLYLLYLYIFGYYIHTMVKESSRTTLFFKPYRLLGVMSLLYKFWGRWQSGHIHLSNAEWFTEHWDFQKVGYEIETDLLKCQLHCKGSVIVVHMNILLISIYPSSPGIDNGKQLKWYSWYSVQEFILLSHCYQNFNEIYINAIYGMVWQDMVQI